MINYIIGYYVFNLQQYLIHKFQHINKIYKNHFLLDPTFDILFNTYK